MINLSDPLIQQQEQHLSTLPIESLRALVEQFEKANELYQRGGEFPDRAFWEFSRLLDRLDLIFPFDWMRWTEGRSHLRDPHFDFSTCSLLELSMYLTTIYRADRYMEGTIDVCFRDGTLQKIVAAIKLKAISKYDT